MRKFYLLTTLALLGGLVAPTFTCAQAPGQSLNALGRWLGYGWSRGYHSQDGCEQCLGNFSGPTATLGAHAYHTHGQMHPAPSLQPTQQSAPQPALQWLAPAVTPAAPLPAPKPENKPAPRSVLPAPKPAVPSNPKTMPPMVEGPKEEEARYWQRSESPLRSQRYPLQAR